MDEGRPRYVALLRGVNVGGANKVGMKELKAVFESLGLLSVKTYINSGNVVFATKGRDRALLTRRLERAIAEHFHLQIRVLVRDQDEIKSIVGALPPDWADDKTKKCDVLFLWDEIDEPSIVAELNLDAELENVRYTPGAVIRCVDREYASRSRLPRVVGTPLYQQMTLRNCNTARRLLQLMQE